MKRLLNAVMDRRARQLMQQVRDWLPSDGPILDLGSGTGHLSARLERELGVHVIAADVTDIHVVGPPPVLVSDGALPFGERTFSAALLFFMLAYPRDPAAVLAEAARVTRGPVVLIQTLHANRFGCAWLRAREFVWTTLAFHVSRLCGYVARDTQFTMATQRFYTAQQLRGDVLKAGLRVRVQRERRLLPGGSLVIARWLMVHD